MVERLTGDRHAPFNQRPNFLGLGDCRDNSTFNFRLVWLVLRVALGQKQGAGQVLEHRFSMRWGPTQNAASLAMTHGYLR